MAVKVLLVDDEVEVVNFLSHFLRRMKMEPTPVTSGEKALKVFEKGKFDLVFLDIKMPGMDGLEVLKKLKDISPDVKVVMVTGRDDKESQEIARRLGAVDYIVKPLDLGEFKEKVTKHIGLQRQE